MSQPLHPQRLPAPWARYAVRALQVLLAVVAAGCSPPPKAKLFAAYEEEMRARGFLRTDRDPADAPYTNAQLAEHFRRIAFFDFPNDQKHVAKPLTRWEGPVMYAVIGTGTDVPAVERLMAHLAEVTDLSIEAVDRKQANFLIMVLDEPAQRFATGPAQDPDTRAFFERLIGSVFDCGALAIWSEDDPVIRQVLVYLHGDLRDLYRKLCLHEEIAQSLGLFNDDPTVRPSIFNDDDEFALLTTHDEYLLRILYDRRLQAGMTAHEAMPLVERIIEELRPGS